MRTSAHVLQEKRAGWRHLQGVCSGLLLLCVVASEVWDAETKPIEFVCHRGMRRSLNIAADTQRALVSSPNPPSAPVGTCALTAASLLQRSCNGSVMLATPVQLPCIELHVTSWQSQTVRLPCGGPSCPPDVCGLSGFCVCASTRRREGTSWRPWGSSSKA